MITLRHAIKIAAKRDAVYRSFTEVAGLTGWQLGTIKGEVDLGKTLVMERRRGLRFGWQTAQLEPGRKIVQTCVEGPGASIGKTLTISLSDEPDGRTLVQLSDAGWSEDDPHLPLCNTYWGEALSRLRDAHTFGAMHLSGGEAHRCAHVSQLTQGD